jgi:hypothetical protein
MSASLHRAAGSPAPAVHDPPGLAGRDCAPCLRAAPIVAEASIIETPRPVHRAGRRGFRKYSMNPQFSREGLRKWFGNVTHRGEPTRRPRASRERLRRSGGPAWFRQDRHWHMPGGRPRLQHVGPGAPTTAARPVARATRRVPACRSQGERANRRRKAQPHRQDRRRDESEPGAQGADGARFPVVVSPSGRVARPLSEAARQTASTWEQHSIHPQR